MRCAHLINEQRTTNRFLFSFDIRHGNYDSLLNFKNFGCFTYILVAFFLILCAFLSHSLQSFPFQIQVLDSIFRSKRFAFCFLYKLLFCLCDQINCKSLLLLFFCCFCVFELIAHLNKCSSFYRAYVYITSSSWIMADSNSFK